MRFETAKNYFSNFGWELRPMSKDVNTMGLYIRPQVRWVLIRHIGEMFVPQFFETIGKLWRWWHREVRRVVAVYEIYERIARHYMEVGSEGREAIQAWVKWEGLSPWQSEFRAIERQVMGGISQSERRWTWLGLNYVDAPSHFFRGLFFKNLSTYLVMYEKQKLEESIPRSLTVNGKSRI